MTAYATGTDFINAFGTNEYNQLCDKDNTGEPVYDGFNAALLWSTEKINEYIGARYVVPLTEPVSELVRRCCIDLARYKLYDDNITDEVTNGFNEAMKWLEKVKSGVTDIQGAVLLTEGLKGRVPVIATGDDAIFTTDYLSKLL